MIQDRNHTFMKAFRAVLVATMSLLLSNNALAQVTVQGSVFGGGNEADVKINTIVNISAGNVEGNVYGGGNLGDVGTIDKSDQTNYNYTWRKTDGTTANTAENNKITVTNTNTGVCTVTITGGTIGTENGATANHTSGHVFGAGKGSSTTWWCEKGIVFATNVSVSGSTVVYGTVYGGGEVGRVEDDAKVTIGTENGSGEGSKPDIKGNVFGAGAGINTHGYSALLRGNTDVIIQGIAKVGGCVYGGGETASVGKFKVVDGLPTEPQSGGTCKVTIQDNAKIGASGTDHNVFGACKGVTPTYVGSGDNRSKSMQLLTNAPSDTNLWSHYNNDNNSLFIWRYYATEADYLEFLKTLALTSHTNVTIDENSSVYGSVFGGGEMGVSLGNVDVNINGGTVYQDVYGGGALADTNKGNVTAERYDEATVTEGETIVTGMYTRSGAGTDAEPYEYTEVTDENTIAASGTTYYTRASQSSINTTTVGLLGGIIHGDAYGGGLGEAGKPAYVWGDVLVDLNGTTPIDGTTHKPSTTGTATTNATGCVVGQVFGGNNVNGTPKGDVMVHVYATQNAAATQIANTSGGTPVTNAKVKGRYDVTAVYGGGNQAAYNPISPYTTSNTSGAKTQVIIEGCGLTSIETVYGGGNAAAVPETNVEVRGTYEIGYVFGGGNGRDEIAPGVENPGADVGTLDQGETTYGTGNVNTLLEGGLIHEAYGGSNQKGIIKGSINQTTDPDESDCELEVEKIVGAGKYADIDGDVNMTLSCQPEKKVDLLFAGADEANVNGNITLNITNGTFGQVFGGNNLGGAIKGKITVNVEETGCQPIKIDNLYLGSNEAAYSVFGYYISEEDHPVTGKKILKPRESATDTRKPVKHDGTEYASITDFTNYAQPELNIISCTYIGNVFGGGLGTKAKMYANPTVNVNMVPGLYANNTTKGVPAVMTELGLNASENPDKLGIIRNVYGGGDAADIEGSTTVNIATEEGKSAYIIGSVFGGGNAADVLANTNVTMSGGYVFNGIFGGGYAGNVGTFTRSKTAADTNVYGHTTHDGCIGKPTACAEGTGKCTVVVDGGQIGPISVATEGMNRPESEGGPVPQGWVWGGGQGLIEDPAKHPDTHFSSYVGSTDVTIGGTAFIMESIIGGGEFGRVLGNTKVTITGHCQIGVGEGMVANGKPIRYTDGYNYGNGATTNQFIDPSTTEVTSQNALVACSHFPYGENIGTDQAPNWVYLPYDPYYDTFKNTDYIKTEHPDLSPASTSKPSDGKTWIGCVFAGGSGYMPYLKKDDSGNPVGYDWCSSAGLVERNTELIISGGHILTNVYGGNEVTNVKGTCKITMTGGTIGVPRTLEQILAHPVICNLFGAGKGDQRPHFNTETNVQEVEIDVSGGIIYGSIFGGGEDGHVQRDVKMTIGKDDHSGPKIGTWGTSYMDGNVFGGGRGFGGDAYTAGNVAGSVDIDIKGGNILGSVYGGGRLGSVGYGLYPPTAGETYYGAMRPDNTGDDANNTAISNFKRGYVDIEISGGTIGNTHEYIVPRAANTPSGLNIANIANWTDANWTTWKTHNNIPLTEFDKETYRLKHTKGGNVFTGGMGRLYQLDGTTPISSVDWWKLGCVKQTKLTVKGGTIKSNVYGGGELGAVKPYVNGTTVQGGTTEIIIQNENSTQIGTEVKDGSDVTQYTFGSVYGGGYGSTVEFLGTSDNPDTENDNPKFVAGLVYGDTKINMQGGKVLASVYGGGEVASVNGSADVAVSGGEVGKDKVGNQQFGGPTMGNVYGGGSGHPNIVRCGRILKNTKVTISGTNTGTKIYHNVYGGGAYGTVGDFNYSTGTDGKVNGVSSLRTANTGKAEVIITGGTIGIDGRENGMVFGSSRGDVNKPGERDDHTAWVYDAFVTIGASGSDAGPDIKGSVYGSGENGHTFHDTDVKIHSGIIGVASGSPIIDNNGTPDNTSDDITYNGAEYPYRGNVYGGGCGTDKYYATGTELHDGNGDTYNPLAGVVYGKTQVTIDGGQIVHNVYGAGAMGSVGKTHESGAIIQDGTTTITISGGKIGVDGTKGDGNVFGAARGDVASTQTHLAQVRSTSVSMSNGTVHGNVYGGGEAGDVGTYTYNNATKVYTWDKINNTEIGDCTVEITGGTVAGHVFGAGKGEANTFQCEKAMARATSVSISNGTVNGNVYGGGEVGRVDQNTTVEIGAATGTSEPHIGNSVFGAGAGVATHGYSALVRGNTHVTVQNHATVGHSVYGGGEIASVGQYGLDEANMPNVLKGGGYCYVTVKGNANIAKDVFGAGKGVETPFNNTDSDHKNRSRRMTLYTNATDFKSDYTTKDGNTWEYYDATDHTYVWEYFKDEPAYANYLTTLALATHPEVTIEGDAIIGEDVYGGGERGLTKGSVIVNINAGNITRDVYGGGALAHTNTTSTVGHTDAEGHVTLETVHPTTTVNLHGGIIGQNVYGGGLGDADTPALVYGDVLVKLNENNGEDNKDNTDNCVVKGSVFGCNNMNGSPQKNVVVHIYKTQGWEGHTRTADADRKDENATHTYELLAVYGGGNQAAYDPVDAHSTDVDAKNAAHTNVIIDGCGLTSIQTVYGGGNAASTPATNVTVNGTYEINEVFGGGNGLDAVNGKPNPGANVGYMNYSEYYQEDEVWKVRDKADADTKEERLAGSYAYGSGVAALNIFGGLVHKVFGGSNTKGNVRQTAVTMLDDQGCDFCVDEAYGGGKSAPMDAEAQLHMACIPGLKVAYGGAEEAEIQGNVTLNITNGTYERVFGGNNKSGTIRGSITVNIEETGCKPIIIGELYGGGNLAGYSVYGYNSDETPIESGSEPLYDSPQVNVKSFTSIGDIYGGGYGTSAVMVGNPAVNINVTEGTPTTYPTTGDFDNEGYKGTVKTIAGHSVTLPKHKRGEIGAINNVYGGGNAAKVIGNTNVNIGTMLGEQIEMVTMPKVQAVDENNEPVVDSQNNPVMVYQTKEVKGANIIGNVYGGGNNAEVTGDANVQIGK